MVDCLHHILKGAAFPQILHKCEIFCARDCVLLLDYTPFRGCLCHYVRAVEAITNTYIMIDYLYHALRGVVLSRTLCEYGIIYARDCFLLFFYY